MILELFTSQGCSSCPAADRLISKLARSEAWRGKILPLAFHVDYWNYIGWTDPFSSAEWSRRQEGYAAAFDSGRIYTPQLVLNGVEECVGSDEASVGRLLRKLSRQASAFEVTVAAWSEGTELVIETAARLRPGADRGEGPPEHWVAVTENGLTTAVGRGENARRTLHNDFVVRRLLRVGPSGRLSVPLDPSWNRAGLAVVAFAQEPRSRRIRGAATVAIQAPSS